MFPFSLVVLSFEDLFLQDENVQLGDHASWQKFEETEGKGVGNLREMGVVIVMIIVFKYLSI
jgi:hypothetical protein